MMSARNNLTRNVKGIPYGYARRYTTQEEARQAFDVALKEGKVQRVTLNIDTVILTWEAFYGSGN
jgi:hypothetical protein